MRIFADKSELREGSRLPKAIIKSAKSVDGLEERTGADLLISPLNIPITSDFLLRKHTESGMLIQRKTEGDLPSSIVDGRLFNSLEKMLYWTRFPWLVFVGQIKRTSDGHAKINRRDTLPYMAVIGALDKWSVLGGYWSTLYDDTAFTEWINSRAKFLRKLETTKVKRVVHQKLIGNDPLYNILVSLPSVGEKTASALLDDMEGQGLRTERNLLTALDWLTNYEYSRNNQKEYIKPNTRKRVREFLGLHDAENYWDFLSVSMASKEEKTKQEVYTEQI